MHARTHARTHTTLHLLLTASAISATGATCADPDAPGGASTPLALAADGGAEAVEECALDEPCEPDGDSEPAVFADVAALGRWHELGPDRGGRLDGIVVRRQDGAMLVASPGGGVWRRFPGTSRWEQPESAGLTDWSVVHLEIDLVNPERIWAVTWNALFYTEDLGDSFVGVVNASGTPTTPHVRGDFLSNAKPFAQLIVGPERRAVYFGRPCLGLWWSFDGEPGTFSLQFPFPAPPPPQGPLEDDNCIGAITADPVTRQVWVSTLVAGHIYRSCAWSDGVPCLDWYRANRCSPGAGASSVCVCPPDERCQLSNSHVADLRADVSRPGSPLLAILGTRPDMPTEILRFGGDAWRLVGGPGAGDQAQPRVLTLVAGDLFLGNKDAWWSGDGGRRWSRMSDSGDHHVDHRAVFADRGVRRVWTTTDGEFDGTHANIVRWNWSGSRPRDPHRVSDRGIRAIQAYFVGVVPETESTSRMFLTGTLDNRAFCSTRGRDWSYRGAAGLGGDVISFQQSAADPRVGYMLNNDGGVFASATLGAGCARLVFPSGWVRRASPPSSPSQSWSRRLMAVHPTRPRTLYVATQFHGIALSVNGAGIWGSTDPPPARPTALFAGETFLYVGTENGVFRRPHASFATAAWEDLGLSEPVVPAPPPSWAYLPTVQAIDAASEMQPLFAATTEGVFRRGRGINDVWELVLMRPGAFSDVLVDRTCPRRVYVALGQQTAGSSRSIWRHGGGVWASSDAGESWQSLTEGTPLDYVPITDLEQDPAEPQALYVATFGRGVWRWRWDQLAPCSGGPL